MRRLGGRDELLPYYDLAGRMLGVVRNPVETAQDVLMRETAAEIGREGTFRPTPVAVYFGRRASLPRIPISTARDRTASAASFAANA